MSEQDKIILDTDEEAARFTTNLSGWISRHGRFFGDDETCARIDGATHKKCKQCEQLIVKTISYNYGMSYFQSELCHVCKHKESEEREKKRYDSYEIIPFKEWPIYSQTYSKYFFDADELIDFIQGLSLLINFKKMINDPYILKLLKCEPIFLWEIFPEDIYADILCEQGIGVPEEIKDAFKTLNIRIRECQIPISWVSVDKAIDLKSLWDHISYCFFDEKKSNSGE